MSNISTWPKRTNCQDGTSTHWTKYFIGCTYGLVCLSQALVLLRQDGTHSFDALRKSGKHRHHGLDLTHGSTTVARSNVDIETFFTSLQCDCHTKNGIPWGQFSLFYRSLVPCAFSLQQETHDAGKSAFLKQELSQVCADLLPIDLFISKRFNTLDLITTLPDMYFHLQEVAIRPNLCRGDVKATSIRYWKKGEHGNEQLEKLQTTHDFFINDISSDQKDHILRFYKEKNPNIDLKADFGSNIHLALTKVFPAGEPMNLGYYPDIVDDINARKFYILGPETYIPEPAAHFIILFCLGMLSRYSADIWMKALDENVRVAELTDSLLNIIYRKFPNLILDQLTWVKHYTHL